MTGPRTGATKREPERAVDLKLPVVLDAKAEAEKAEKKVKEKHEEYKQHEEALMRVGGEFNVVKREHGRRKATMIEI